MIIDIESRTASGPKLPLVTISNAAMQPRHRRIDELSQHFSIPKLGRADLIVHFGIILFTMANICEVEQN